VVRSFVVTGTSRYEISLSPPKKSDCVFCALEGEGVRPVTYIIVITKETTFMKKLALPMAAVLALLSIAGCAQYVGKGKAPPPVVTKG
jgi:hypothetical protein